MELSPWGFRLSLKKLRGAPFLWAHHLQEGPKGSGPKSLGWQPKAGNFTVRFPAAEASSRDVECHLSDGEGAQAGARD